MSKIDITIYDLFGEKGDSAYVLVDIKKINEYINLAKSLEVEHETLKKDVARFLELDGYYMDMITEEYSKLRDKLSNVGKEK